MSLLALHPVLQAPSRPSAGPSCISYGKEPRSHCSCLRRKG